MKVFCFMRLILCGILCLVITSCSSEENDESNNGSGEFIMASVETLSFESSDVADGVTASKIESTNSTTYLVQGFDDAGNAIVLTIADFDGVGTYNFTANSGDNDASGLFLSQSAAWSSFGGTGGSGTIDVLTDTENKTTGTFEFVGVQADMVSSIRAITNGRYSANYDK